MGAHGLAPGVAARRLVAWPSTWAVVAGVALVLLANDYWLLVTNRALVTVIAAAGMAILAGASGQLSVAQGAFVAIGGYGAAVAAAEGGLPLVPATGAAVAAALVLSLVVGLPALRLDSLYLAVATLAFHVAVLYAVRQMEVTGGSTGHRLPVTSIGAWRLDDRADYTVVLLVVTLAAVAAVDRLLRSRTGRALTALRDRDLAAAALGIDVTRMRLLAFAISAVLGAVAGSIDAFATRTITPDTYPLTLSIQLLTVVIVGGLGSLRGAVAAGLILSLVPEALRGLTNVLDDLAPRLSEQVLALQTGIYGLFLVLVLVLQPDGLAGLWPRARSLRLGRPGGPGGPETSPGIAGEREQADPGLHIIEEGP